MRARPRASPRTPARTRRAAGRATDAPSGAPRARAPPRARRAAAGPRGSRGGGRGPAGARGLAAAGQHAGLERVDERLPARLDHVLGDADRAPRVDAVGGVEQHARDGAGALPLVQDADLEVDELDVAEVRVGLADGLAERLVERVHGAVALGGAEV